jgi:hypothetical protein
LWGSYNRRVFWRGCECPWVWLGSAQNRFWRTGPCSRRAWRRGSVAVRAGFFGCWGESAEAAQLGDVGVERGHGLGASVGGAGGVWLIRASGGGCGGEAADVEERDRVPEGSVGGVGGGGEGVADRGFGLWVVPGEAVDDPLVDGEVFQRLCPL